MPNKVSKRDCDHLMRDILDCAGTARYFDRSEKNEDFFKRIEDSPEELRALEFLESKKYIYTDKNPVSHKILRIRIKDTGFTYFEDAAEKRREKQVSWTQYIITTVIATLGLILAAISIIWQMITWNAERSATSDGTPSVEVLAERQKEQTHTHLVKLELV